MMKYLTRKERVHILRNLPPILLGIIKNIEKIKKNISYWPIEQITKQLTHLETELYRHARDLDYLGKQGND